MMKNLRNEIINKMLNAKSKEQRNEKMKLKKLRSSRDIRYWLLGLLLIGMAAATTNFYPWGMAGLTGFLLAYLSKGMRRYRPPQ